jgi:predicted AlkP superfamily pyrophosphatase or phosphodiesterase
MPNPTLLVLVDGMRPDGLQKAHTPALDALIREGAWTLDATTVMPSITLPCIVSLFQGTTPDEHGVTTNLFSPASVQVSLFEVITQAGLKTASFYNWEQLRDLAPPGTLRTSLYRKNSYDPEGTGDTELTQLALDVLRRDPVDFAFLYLGHTDVAGHAHGWMSTPYLRAIENADRCLATALDALPGWNVVVTADHGGHDTGHGTESPDDMTIPIVLRRDNSATASGPIDRPVSILDIAPTVTSWLGLTAPPSWQGRPLA